MDLTYDQWFQKVTYDVLQHIELILPVLIGK